MKFDISSQHVGFSAHSPSRCVATLFLVQTVFAATTLFDGVFFVGN
jgi:hypothetical protein